MKHSYWCPMPRAMGLSCWILAVCLLGFAWPVAGQAPSGAIPTIVPPSPTAAALEKYGQVPVSTYTGVPSISVPLYEIKVRDLSLPLSLSYHAGGFRVSEEASWVGLGWSLLAGGAITRTVRNLDDLTYFINANPSRGYPYAMPDPTAAREPIPGSQATQAFLGNGFNQGDLYTGAYSMVHSCQSLFINGTLNSTEFCGRVVGPLSDVAADWEPDDFRFSMGGHSGQFAFRQDGSIHVLEQQKMRIVPPVRGQPDSPWQITTPDGYQYFFAAKEDAVAITPVQQAQRMTTAWYLTRIVSPLGEEATLSYRQGGAVYNQAGLSENTILNATSNQTCVNIAGNGGGSFSMGWSFPQYLQRISFKTGCVDFERDSLSARADLRGGQRLKRIVIYNAEHQLQKAFELEASYFVSPFEPSHLPINDAGGLYEGKRLRLDAVVESGKDGVAKPATTFFYNATQLPIKSSYSVDFWGYFNGVLNNTLLPEYSGPNLEGNYMFRAGADRRPVASAMQACILEKITYPTGGSTSFTFEPHAYGNTSGTYAEAEVTQVQFPLRFGADDVDPSNNIPNDSSFTVFAPTPLTLNYLLTAYTAESRARTKLVLIDDATGNPLLFTNTVPGHGTVTFSRVWEFPYPSNPTYTPSDTYRGQDNILVPPGRYHFAAQLMPLCAGTAPQSFCHGRVYVTASFPRIAAPSAGGTAAAAMAGGLRVRHIENADGLGAGHNQVQVYEYAPGTLMNRPVFTSRTNFSIGDPSAPGGNGTCDIMKLLSYNQSCFSAGAKGNTVGYSQVSVLQGNQGEGGKTEYLYHCLPDREPRYEGRLPNIPMRSDDLNGYLKRQITYRKTASGYQETAETTNEYESVNRADLPGMHKGPWYVVDSFNGVTTYAQPFYFYPIASRWVRLVQTTSRQYDPQDVNKSLFTTTRYTYDTLNVGHMQVSQVKTRRSDGSTALTSTTYPADYTAVTSGSLAQMRSDAYFQHQAVVETTTRIYGVGQTAADAKTVAGTYTEFAQPNSSRRFVPVKEQALELAIPTAGLEPSAPILPPVQRYALKAQIAYDPATLNVQEVKKEHDVPTTYLWGYQHTLPVASVFNASANQVQTALTAMNVDLNALTTESALRTACVQLRTRLPQARITSFTYEPLVGVTSQTDPSGRTTSYEYDGLGRLLRTRDDQGRILSQQQYHYAGH